MFNSLSSYIWGSAEEEQQQQQAAAAANAAPDVPMGAPAPPALAKATRHPSRQSSATSEEDWVLVGGGADPAGPARGPGITLGSLNEINPRPSTGSTGSSSNSPSERGEEEEEDEEFLEAGMALFDQAADSANNRPVPLTRSQRRMLTPFSSGCSSSLSARKHARAAQAAQQKRAGKSNTAKATERRNKAVKNLGGSCSKRQGATRLSLGIKSSGPRTLKQC